LPKVYEKVVGTVKGEILTDKKCLHLRALKKFKDYYGNIRNPGEEWLITNKMAQLHIPDVYEEIIAVENSITLSSRQFCVVLNPVGKDGKNVWGTKQLIKVLNFFKKIAYYNFI
jgi:major vault protein